MEDGRTDGTDLIFRLTGLALLLGERAVPRWLREPARPSRRPMYVLRLLCRCWGRLARKRGHKRLLLRLVPTHGYPLRRERCTDLQTRRCGGIQRPGTACADAAANDAHCDVW